MNDNTIDSLREALKHSPDNTPLRQLLADTLLTLNRLDEAETEFSIRYLKYQIIIKQKLDLRQCFTKKEVTLLAM
jgi:transitional endoplasmic reticulum ATPase